MTQKPTLRGIITHLHENDRSGRGLALLDTATGGAWSAQVRRRGITWDLSRALPILAILTAGLAPIAWLAIDARRRTEVTIRVHARDGDLQHRTRLRGRVPDQPAIETAARKFIDEALQAARMNPPEANPTYRRRRSSKTVLKTTVSALAGAYLTAVIVASKIFGW